MSDSMFDYFRNIVSGKKKRYRQDGFNLDLSYITEKLLAMGYPADSVHKAFRNDIVQVYNFFEKYHSGHWKILNVAMEISYRSTKVGGNVIVMGFEDHTPPPFIMLLEIIETMHQWLTEDPDNVIAVHCKAGKGRTGTVISSYLLYMMKQSTPELFYSSDTLLYNTISFFNSMRANNSECVTVPSQKRYVGYYIQWLRDLNEQGIPRTIVMFPNGSPQLPKFKIINIDIIGINSFVKQPHFNIEIHLNYNPTIRNLPIVLRGSNSNIMYYQECYSYLMVEKDIIVKGDTLIRFNSLDSHSCIFRLLFHTSFLPTNGSGDSPYTTLFFKKDNLDGGSGGVFNDPKFSTDFSIRLLLEPIIINNNNNQEQQHQQELILNNNNNSEEIHNVPPQIPCRSLKPTNYNL